MYAHNNQHEYHKYVVSLCLFVYIAVDTIVQNLTVAVVVLEPY